jgi:hypothetical protein
MLEGRGESINNYLNVCINPAFMEVTFLIPELMMSELQESVQIEHVQNG